ncbi:hypothetical protein X741_30270 [Mesorhizobium sp. LNHC229A00]|nr:hypothetical protein X741_30270 [Mesorhizobium sp. LNHC229A00]
MPKSAFTQDGFDAPIHMPAPDLHREASLRGSTEGSTHGSARRKQLAIGFDAYRSASTIGPGPRAALRNDHLRS